MSQSGDKGGTTVILGGGLAGLSAGYVLTKAGRKTVIFEADSTVGGLSKTIVAGEFRFDLGGHRFFTKDKRIENFVKELMGEELISVSRKSKIYLKNKYFDYPLRPLNAISGMGILTTLRIISDYGKERLKNVIGNGRCVSLEDWVVRNFGRTMFDIYFKQYSEKVWGLDCSRISQKWVAQRIQGLSLGRAIKNAFFRLSGEKVPSLVDKFLYPQLGIGRISDRLKEEIVKVNRLFTSASVVQLNHKDFKIQNAVVSVNGNSHVIEGEDFVSTIPINALVRMLQPEAPPEVLDAASRLGYRDLLIVAVMINRERVTDQTWIYIPEQKIPFGRIHEPKNWSEKMAPVEKTLIVTEYFCFKGDDIWRASDKELSEITVSNLENLGFIRNDEVIGTIVIRVPKAYPLFEVGYEEYCNKVWEYLDKFENLYIAGRTGMFKYHNMDHAIETGIEVAESIMKKRRVV
jgi:protoporphyrinogen oxidase